MPITAAPGSRFRSAVCECEVIVVRGSGEFDLRCGGAAMVAKAEAGDIVGELDPGFAGGTTLGKRFVVPDAGLELLCVKSGAGTLALGTTAFDLKEAKPLPSSD